MGLDPSPLKKTDIWFIGSNTYMVYKHGYLVCMSIIFINSIVIKYNTSVFSLSSYLSYF